MLVKRFLTWIQTAPAEARAAATLALAEAWLAGELGQFETSDATAAMTLMLDDEDVRVRQALAQVFADRQDAPEHIVVALAMDVIEVAEPVLRASPLLADGDLVEWIATGGAAVQCAIAARRPLPAPVAAAVAEVGEADAAAVLVHNREAAIPVFSLARLAERFGGDRRVADALLARDDLGVTARFDLLANRREGADGAARDRQDKAAVAVARGLEDEDLADFVGELRRRSLLTASLLLRAVASGEIALFEAVLAELSGLARPRVAALAAERRGAGFPALCRKVGLPSSVVEVFRAALATLEPTRAARDEGLGRLYAPSWILARIRQSAAVTALDSDDPLALALQRLAADFAREEARNVALALVPPPPARGEPLLLDASMVVDSPRMPALVQDNEPAEALVPPSYGAMAALLEETVAAALANLPPPAAPREEGTRTPVVIDGEWVGVAVDHEFDPGQFRVDIAA